VLFELAMMCVCVFLGARLYCGGSVRGKRHPGLDHEVDGPLNNCPLRPTGHRPLHALCPVHLPGVRAAAAQGHLPHLLERGQAGASGSWLWLGSGLGLGLGLGLGGGHQGGVQSSGSASARAPSPSHMAVCCVLAR